MTGDARGAEDLKATRDTGGAQGAAAIRRTFAALAIPNYRRYFAGQAISLVGTWMQSVAQGWLVLVLTGSGTALGLVVALQMLPVLILGPYGGVVADRVDKRRLMIVLQAQMGVLALVLGLLTVTGAVRLWHVCLLAVCLGLNNAFENPARQAFVLEMVGPGMLRNAVSLNSVLVNVARAIGPAVAGVLIATVGIGVCFLINAASFVAVVVSLVTLQVAALAPSPPARRARGQLREGLRYVRRTPALVVPLVMMALIGTLAYEFQVVLPVLAEQTFRGGPEAYGFMTAAMGVGAVAGGLVTASRGRTGLRPLVVAAAVFGFVILAAAAAPNLAVGLVALTFVGAGSIAFIAVGNTTLQLTAAPHMRGRVMALWTVAFLGTTPIGGPIAGFVSEYAGPRVGLGMGGLACLIAAGVGFAALRCGVDAPAPSPVDPPGPPVLPDPVLPDPVLPDPVLPDPVLPDPVLPDPVLPDPVLPDPVLPDPVLPDPVLPGPVVPAQADPAQADPAVSRTGTDRPA